MNEQTPPGLIPVAKKGKFFGYADPGQVAKHKLERYDSRKPAADPEPAKKEEDKTGANPKDVKKGPSGKQ